MISAATMARVFLQATTRTHTKTLSEIFSQSMNGSLGVSERRQTDFGHNKTIGFAISDG
jgi:hypothetical protein